MTLRVAEGTGTVRLKAALDIEDVRVVVAEPTRIGDGHDPPGAYL